MPTAHSDNFKPTERVEEIAKGRLEGEGVYFKFHFRSDKSTN